MSRTVVSEQEIIDAFKAGVPLRHIRGGRTRRYEVLRKAGLWEPTTRTDRHPSAALGRPRQPVTPMVPPDMPTLYVVDRPTTRLRAKLNARVVERTLADWGKR